MSDRDRRRSKTALCLWLPTFELRAELVRFPELDETSVALLEEGGAGRVSQVSERAWDAGVRPGTSVSEAVGVCPSLTLLEPDPTHYDATMEALLETLGEVSPILEPRGRGRIFVGMDGMERLYGPPERQAERALQALMKVLPPPLTASVRPGWAPGRFGSWVAAVASSPGRPTIVLPQHLTEFLSSRPTSSLPVTPSVVERLQRLGLSTLGDILRIPEAALVRHFGQKGRTIRGWASGERIDPVRSVHRPRPIQVHLDLPSPVGLTPPLHGALEHLVERLLSRPGRRDRGVKSLRLRARLEEGGSWDLQVTLREPSARKEDMVFPLRCKLDLSPPPRAVEALQLEAFEFGPSTSQPDLFSRNEEGARSRGGGRAHGGLDAGEVPPSLRSAVRELKLRLGHSPLYRVVELDPWSRIPERRYALLGFDP